MKGERSFLQPPDRKRYALPQGEGQEEEKGIRGVKKCQRGFARKTGQFSAQTLSTGLVTKKEGQKREGSLSKIKKPVGAKC